MRNYIGLIHKDLDSDYGVSFPDFPGVVTALAFHVEGLEADGEAIPEPSSLENIMTDPANRDGVAILVATFPAKVIRVNITLPADVLAKIDEYADSRGLTRSGFILRLAKRALQTPGGRTRRETGQGRLKAGNPSCRARVTKRAGKKEKAKRRGPSLKKRVS
jgi:predicted RNase H-like HicB family nuclease